MNALFTQATSVDFVNVICEHKMFCREDFNKYMEGLGAPTPGTMTLTTRLSKPFQQIERYSNLLKELERHSEVSCNRCVWLDLLVANVVPKSLSTIM